MQIALIGITGMIGSRIANEALSRGHSVTAIVRDPARVEHTHPQLRIVTGDAVDSEHIAATIAGHDAVIAAISGRRDGDAQQIMTAAKAVLAGAEQAGVERILWVGGAGSLEIAPGMRLIDIPDFPNEYKPEALAQAESLALFRNNTNLQWTYLSPPAEIAPGTRSGKYQTGGDQLLNNADGRSAISVEDYAVALIDELEQARHVQTRYTVVG